MAATEERPGGEWNVEVAGVPCKIESEQGGEWLVTLASITVARHENLAKAILNAAGGLVGLDEATAVAAGVASSQRRWNGR